MHQHMHTICTVMVRLVVPACSIYIHAWHTVPDYLRAWCCLQLHQVDFLLYSNSLSLITNFRGVFFSSWLTYMCTGFTLQSFNSCIFWSAHMVYMYINHTCTPLSVNMYRPIPCIVQCRVNSLTV